MPTKVSEAECVGAISIALIIIGIVITVPAFLVGSQILRSLGLMNGSLALVISCVIIAALSSLCMRLASKYHISTYQLSQSSFGIYGSRMVSALIATTLLGWFAMTANLFGAASLGLSQKFKWGLPIEALIIAGCTLVILTVIFGFRALEKFSRFATPLLVALLAAGIILVLRKHGVASLIDAKPTHLPGMATMGSAISVVIGAFMVAVTISPDFARFAKSPSDGVRAAWLGYGIGGSCVLIGAGLPGLAIGSDDLIGSFAATGLGLGAFILLLVATWTTNAGNLYSTRLAGSQVFPRIKPITLCIILGVIGTSSALWLDLSYFGKFLQFLAISIPPIAGIYLCDGYALGKDFNIETTKKYDMSGIFAWLSGTCVALLVTIGPLGFLSIPALTGLVVAFMSKWALSEKTSHKEKL